MKRAELVTKAFTAAGREDRQGGFPFQNFRNDLGLSVSELVEAEDALECGNDGRIDRVHIIATYSIQVIITCNAYVIMLAIFLSSRC